MTTTLHRDVSICPFLIIIISTIETFNPFFPGGPGVVVKEVCSCLAAGRAECRCGAGDLFNNTMNLARLWDFREIEGGGLCCMEGDKLELNGGSTPLNSPVCVRWEGGPPPPSSLTQ
jgi:hypothetical protein